VHGNILDPKDGEAGYLCINEALINYKSVSRAVPIEIKYFDHICHHRIQEKQSSFYKENTMLIMMYLIDINIWDMLIRQGLINGTVDISSQQTERIIYPVLCNENKNLLHIFSRNNFKALKEIFLKCELEDCLDKSQKTFPLFKDFKNMSPLDYAYEKKNIQMVYFLLKKMIEFQDGFESQHLLTTPSGFSARHETLIEDAIADGFDISFIFDSMVFTQKLSKESFQVYQEMTA
jgi:hypothetical protein